MLPLVGFLCWASAIGADMTESKIIKLRFGQRAQLGSSALHFSKVVEDSRCPQGTDCFWAGIVVAELKIIQESGESNGLVGNVGGSSVVVGKTFDPKLVSYDEGASKVGQYQIELQSITPVRSQSGKIKEQDYEITLSVKADKPTQHSVVPKAGYVPNQETAVAIAEAVWVAIYGAKVLEKKPFTAKLENDRWIVEGSASSLKPGGVPLAVISKQTGEILQVTHGK